MKTSREESRKFRLSGVIYAGFLSAAVILGRHIHVTSPYDALADENYILPYSLKDLVFFLLLTAILSILFHLAVRILDHPKDLYTAGSDFRDQRTRFLALTGVLFLLWVPYLLRYYPGFVFPDTYNALQQALGQTPFNNRNPVLYSLFLRLCLYLSGGDVTRGCLLYTLFQMLCMAVGFAYMSCWCYARFSLKSPLWTFAAVAVFGLNPYIAADSIAMWKDPLFSMAVSLWSLGLADFALYDGKIRKRRWWLSFFGLNLFILFWRNNGFCAVLAVLLLLFIMGIRHREYRRLGAGVFCTILCFCFVQIPLFKMLGIGMPKEESAGLMLNQMARVVVYNGEMSETDREYLDELMPLERYPEAYRPCCVDLLKWDGEFHYEALRGSRFLKTWLSLLKKNPRLYFEAWELETYGYWTVNRPEINLNVRNISDGNPYNNDENNELLFGEKSVNFRNLLKAPVWNKLLKKDFWSVPLGLLSWLIAFLGILLSIRGQRKMLLFLAPSFGVLAGLILASPIWYLARYGACAQFLLPVFLLMTFGKKSPGGEESF